MEVGVDVDTAPKQQDGSLDQLGNRSLSNGPGTSLPAQVNFVIAGVGYISPAPLLRLRN